MSDYRRRVSAVCGMLAFLSLLPTANAAAPAIALSSERRHQLQRWLALLQRRSRRRGETGVRRFAQWRAVRLPHDWAIEGPFDPKLNAHTGGLPVFGTGWYRKSFALPAGAKGKYFSIEFDGAMSNSKVWLNGHELGGRPVWLHRLHSGPDAVPEFRWRGQRDCGAADAGGSRVALVSRRRHLSQRVAHDVTGPVYVAHWGTYVTTPKVSDEQASVAVKTQLRNRSGKEVKAAVQTRCLRSNRSHGEP
jgi:beta-galactosidase